MDSVTNTEKTVNNLPYPSADLARPFEPLIFPPTPPGRILRVR